MPSCGTWSGKALLIRTRRSGHANSLRPWPPGDRRGGTRSARAGEPSRSPCLEADSGLPDARAVLRGDRIARRGCRPDRVAALAEAFLAGQSISCGSASMRASCASHSCGDPCERSVVGSPHRSRCSSTSPTNSRHRACPSGSTAGKGSAIWIGSSGSCHRGVALRREGAGIRRCLEATAEYGV